MRPEISCFCYGGDAATCPETTRKRQPETVRGRAKDPSARIQGESLRRVKALPPYLASCAGRVVRDRTRPDQIEPKRCILPARGYLAESLSTLFRRGVHFPVECQFPPSGRRGF